MPFISKETYFNPDEISASVIGIASDFSAHDSGFHEHNKAQLLYAPSGCMIFNTTDNQYILPPTMAAWIPANCSHSVIVRNVAMYRSIYFDITHFPELPNQVAIMNVNELLKQLIERISLWNWDMPIDLQKNTLALFFEELNNTTKENLSIILPKTSKLKHHIEYWNQGKAIPPFLKQLASEIGLSEKTITRIFSRETGMSYQEWRQQWRLHKSIELLAEGRNVGETAHELEFSSDSAFIEFFKKYMKETPSKYFQ